MPDNRDTILLYTSEYPPQVGGVARYYHDLVAAWNKRGAGKMQVVTTKLAPHWLFDVFRLSVTVVRRRPRLVLAGQLLPVGTITWLVSFVLRYDYAIFVHGMDLPYALKRPRKRWLVEHIIARAHTVIAVNSYVQVLLTKEFPHHAKKIAVVNPGVAPRVTANQQYAARLREQYGLQHATVMLQVGRLVARKGVDKVLEGLPKAVAQCPSLRYVIVGDGPKKNALYAASKKLQQEGRVVFIDNATDDEVRTWYACCDFFIMPSRNINGDFEGFGIVYLEANAYGKPVIAGDSGGVRDAVVDGVNGLLVDPESVEDIAAATVKLCNDESLRKKLGEQGRERVKEFSWEKQVEKLAKALDL